MVVRVCKLQSEPTGTDLEVPKWAPAGLGWSFWGRLSGEPRKLNRSTGRLAERAEAALLRADLSVRTAAASHTMRTTRKARVLGQLERPGAAKPAR